MEDAPYTPGLILVILAFMALYTASPGVHHWATAAVMGLIHVASVSSP